MFCFSGVRCVSVVRGEVRGEAAAQGIEAPGPAPCHHRHRNTVNPMRGVRLKVWRWAVSKQSGREAVRGAARSVGDCPAVHRSRRDLNSTPLRVHPLGKA